MPKVSNDSRRDGFGLYTYLGLQYRVSSELSSIYRSFRLILFVDTFSSRLTSYIKCLVTRVLLYKGFSWSYKKFNHKDSTFYTRKP